LRTLLKICCLASAHGQSITLGSSPHRERKGVEEREKTPAESVVKIQESEKNVGLEDGLGNGTVKIVTGIQDRQSSAPQLPRKDGLRIIVDNSMPLLVKGLHCRRESTLVVIDIGSPPRLGKEPDPRGDLAGETVCGEDQAAVSP
jgi:hypothetical protein